MLPPSSEAAERIARVRVHAPVHMFIRVMQTEHHGALHVPMRQTRRDYGIPTELELRETVRPKKRVQQ